MEEKQRSGAQNRSIHKYLTMLADELNQAGLDMKVVLKPEVEIPWSLESTKEYLWKPIQKAMKMKESTTELTTKEVDEVYKVLDRHISQKFGITLPFPSSEEEMFNAEQ